jgi:hypothetical protein
LLFVVVGLVVASVLFLALNFVVSANWEAGVGVVERWIVRAMCDRYELEGTVRDSRGKPVAFAVIEATYLDERLATRSNVDGTFVIAAAEAVCGRQPPRTVQLLVLADDFRPKRHSVPFDLASLDITLDARDF